MKKLAFFVFCIAHVPALFCYEWLDHHIESDGLGITEAEIENILSLEDNAAFPFEEEVQAIIRGIHHKDSGVSSPPESEKELKVVTESYKQNTPRKATRSRRASKRFTPVALSTIAESRDETAALLTKREKNRLVAKRNRDRKKVEKKVAENHLTALHARNVELKACLAVQRRVVEEMKKQVRQLIELQQTEGPI